MVQVQEKLNSVFKPETLELIQSRIPKTVNFDKGASFLRRNHTSLSKYNVEDVKNFVFYGAHIVALFELLIEKDISKKEMDTAQNPFFRVELNKLRMGLNKIHRTHIYKIDPVFIPEGSDLKKLEINYPFKEFIYPFLDDILPLMDF